MLSSTFCGSTRRVTTNAAWDPATGGIGRVTPHAEHAGVNADDLACPCVRYKEGAVWREIGRPSPHLNPLINMIRIWEEPPRHFRKWTPLSPSPTHLTLQTLLQESRQLAVSVGYMPRPPMTPGLHETHRKSHSHGLRWALQVGTAGGHCRWALQVDITP